jgi:hypothetical protein
VLVRLFFLLPQVWVGLRVKGFVRMHRWVECPAPGRRYLDAAIRIVGFPEQCASLTAFMAKRGLYQANCLHQSLALCRLLRRFNVPAVLRVGARRDAKGFQAHAWVEVDGMILGQMEHGYTPFDSLRPHQAVSGRRLS